MSNKLQKRFDELEAEHVVVMSTKHSTYSEMFGSSEQVDNEKFLQWCIKAKNLINKSCGTDSEHYKAFEKAEGGSGWSGSFSRCKEMGAVFLATKNDFEGGYLNSYKNLIQAEVFDSELEQASELLGSGYYVASAVIAGTVLETALRDLCDKENIPHGKLDKMNSDLAKAGVFNKIVQKQITSYAGIRNSAAHGKSSEFTADDVKLMISGITQFLVTYLA